MSQNLPKRSLRDFLSLRHPNHFVLAGANNRNVIITYRFLAAPVQVNRKTYSFSFYKTPFLHFELWQDEKCVHWKVFGRLEMCSQVMDFMSWKAWSFENLTARNQSQFIVLRPPNKLTYLCLLRFIYGKMAQSKIKLPLDCLGLKAYNSDDSSAV